MIFARPFDAAPPPISAPFYAAATRPHAARACRVHGQHSVYGYRVLFFFIPLVSPLMMYFCSSVAHRQAEPASPSSLARSTPAATCLARRSPGRISRLLAYSLVEDSTVVLVTPPHRDAVTLPSPPFVYSIVYVLQTSSIWCLDGLGVRRS
ncbi:hypothetical protein HGRIS_011907 [Hohenbuehelia grisea]|uniref:Uncharacterized protein n=1 Tax=Hohenbuehelia grisea TaxID=104357 RepID=A0ABR3JXE5_9AGAR